VNWAQVSGQVPLEAGDEDPWLVKIEKL
jgi:hypothetical protein